MSNQELKELLNKHRKNLEESMKRFEQHSKSFDEKLSKILKSL